MPIPTPAPDEPRNKYLGRCTAFLVREGKPASQAYAICAQRWAKKELDAAVVATKEWLKKPKQ